MHAARTRTPIGDPRSATVDNLVSILQKTTVVAAAARTAEAAQATTAAIESAENPLLQLQADVLEAYVNLLSPACLSRVTESGEASRAALHSVYGNGNCDDAALR